MGVEERGLGPPTRDGERRGRGHYSGRHAEARDQEQPERTFDGGRPSIDLTEHQRHGRAELRVASEEEEASVRPAATPEEATQPALPIRHLPEDPSGVRPDVARLVHVERQVIDRRDPRVVEVPLLQVAEVTRESNRFIASDQDELGLLGAVRTLTKDLLAPG